MNRDQKAAVVEELVGQIRSAEAIFAVDYRGISVAQAAELRARLNEAGARFRVVKNTLTERAADEGGAAALAAKAISTFKRETDLLDFKGGLMESEPVTAEQLISIARLPSREVM